ncbi:MAG: hypothetical protein E7179_06550 [Erysipelotrichaceae bacterium]|nr:hypothetical protein [Erysipelotrichaceae bacterium]
MKRIIAIILTAVFMLAVIYETVRRSSLILRYDDQYSAIEFGALLTGAIATIAIEIFLFVMLIRRKSEILRATLPFLIGWLFVNSFANGFRYGFTYDDSLWSKWINAWYNIFAIGFFLGCGSVTIIAIRCAIKKSMPRNKSLYFLALPLFVFSLGTLIIQNLWRPRSFIFSNGMVLAVPQLLCICLYLNGVGLSDSLKQIEEL